MVRKYVIRNSNVNNVNHTISVSIREASKVMSHKGTQGRVLKGGIVFGHSRFSGQKVKRSATVPVMRQFMNTIQKSKLDPYSVVSNNLALESRKSMERLKALIGGEGK